MIMLEVCVKTGKEDEEDERENYSIDHLLRPLREDGNPSVTG